MDRFEIAVEQSRILASLTQMVRNLRKADSAMTETKVRAYDNVEGYLRRGFVDLGTSQAENEPLRLAPREEAVTGRIL